MGLYYVNCISEKNTKEKEFSSIEEANLYYERCKKEDGWIHIELTKQLKAYLPGSSEELY